MGEGLDTTVQELREEYPKWSWQLSSSPLVLIRGTMGNFEIVIARGRGGQPGGISLYVDGIPEYQSKLMRAADIMTKVKALFGRTQRMHKIHCEINKIDPVALLRTGFFGERGLAQALLAEGDAELDPIILDYLLQRYPRLKNRTAADWFRCLKDSFIKDPSNKLALDTSWGPASPLVGELPSFTVQNEKVSGATLRVEYIGSTKPYLEQHSPGSLSFFKEEPCLLLEAQDTYRLPFKILWIPWRDGQVAQWWERGVEADKAARFFWRTLNQFTGGLFKEDMGVSDMYWLAVLEPEKYNPAMRDQL